MRVWCVCGMGGGLSARLPFAIVHSLILRNAISFYPPSLRIPTLQKHQRRSPRKHGCNLVSRPPILRPLRSGSQMFLETPRAGMARTAATCRRGTSFSGMTAGSTTFPAAPATPRSAWTRPVGLSSERPLQAQVKTMVFMAWAAF